MTGFEFWGVGHILFGVGVRQRLGAAAASHGRWALVIHNGPDEVDRLTENLFASGVRSTHHRQRGEPGAPEIDSVAAAAREQGADLVIGFGGGSAIDAAKAVAALLTNGGIASDYMEVVGQGRKLTRQPAPWIAMPTTAGTGAEATRNAVIGLPERKFKASIRSELMLPRLALIDPELGLSVPPDVTARTGMDALCQLIESYTSNGSGPMTDALALRGIPLVRGALLRAYRDGGALDARSDMALAALLSGIALTSAGLGAVHGFAAPLGANFPIAHGTICAALLPHVIRENIRALQEEPHGNHVIARYATVGRLLAGDDRLPDKEALEASVGWTAGLARDLRIPQLSQFGMRAEDIPAMTELARKSSSMRFNPVTLPDGALNRALAGAIGG